MTTQYPLKVLDALSRCVDLRPPKTTAAVASDSFRFSEPRLVMVEHILSAIDAFSRARPGSGLPGIKRFTPIAAKWRTYKGDLGENLGSPSSSCDSRCPRCYLLGNPLYRPREMLSAEEADFRVAAYDPVTRTGFPVRHREYGEPLLNQHLLDILRRVRRESPHEVLNILTNGNTLDAGRVRELAELKPIHVSVSTNAGSVDKRVALMGNRRGAAVALESLAHLRKHQIPFGASIVAWPELSRAELSEAISYAEQFDPLTIRLVLPGYTRYHDPRLAFDWEEHWAGVAALVREMRQQVKSWIQLQPHAYWIRTIRPEVDGVVPGSPVGEAGLKIGDVITAVNGHPILAKETARYLLNQAAAVPGGELALQVKSGGHERTLTMTDAQDRYPYRPAGYPAHPTFPYGIGLAEGFRPQYIPAMASIIRAKRARRVLVITGTLMRPQLDEAIRLAPEDKRWPDSVEARFVDAEPHFWGGNICLNDLMMVDDYVAVINRVKTEWTPNLVLLPSSAFRCGRDYVGKPYTEISARTGLDLVVMPTARILE